jgi:hypothetical protein
MKVVFKSLVWGFPLRDSTVHPAHVGHPPARFRPRKLHHDGGVDVCLHFLAVWSSTTGLIGPPSNSSRRPAKSVPISAKVRQPSYLRSISFASFQGNFTDLCIHLVYLEFILLSDSLGVSSLVDSINHAKPPGATEATVLGPFFTTDALDCQYSSPFIPHLS